MRTSTWGGSDASTQHLGQRSMSHSSSRAGPSSRIQQHPRQEKSMPGMMLLWKPTSHRWHGDYLLLMPRGEQSCCLAGVRKQGEWDGKGRSLHVLWHHSKVAPFGWTPERKGQYSIDFWTLKTPFPKGPPPFWQTQPNPRASLFLKVSLQASYSLSWPTSIMGYSYRTWACRKCPQVEICPTAFCYCGSEPVSDCAVLW